MEKSIFAKAVTVSTAEGGQEGRAGVGVEAWLGGWLEGATSEERHHRELGTCDHEELLPSVSFLL